MKVIRQGVPALLLSLAILSGSVCLASGAEVQTVRATLWDACPITVDETPICTVNEYDRFQYPLAYNGSVYIPLQTVSDWLGARFDWDETANTVTLTKTGDPYYRHYTLDQPAPWTEEELAQCDADKAEGVEMELRPDMFQKLRFPYKTRAERKFIAELEAENEQFRSRDPKNLDYRK